MTTPPESDPSTFEETRYRSEAPEPSAWLQVLVAVGCSAAALAVRWITDPLLQDHQPFTTAFAAVAVSAWYATWRGGLLCAVLSYLWADYFFMEPRLRIEFTALKAVEAAFYFGLVAVVLYVSHRATKARRSSKHLIARLRAADSQKSELLATLGHELRSPLTAIMSVAEVVDAEGASAEMRKRAALTLRRQSEYMSRLMNDLTDAARIQQGKLELKPEPTAVPDLIDAALEGVEPSMRERRQTCERRLGDNLPPVNVDPARMNQVLTNLLYNACKFSPEGAVIRLEAALTPEGLRLRVVDAGEGIPAGKLEWVFDTFSQMKQGGQGLGLGLSLVRRLVQMHGGSVKALSRGVGEGSTFEVYLPVTSMPANRPAR